MNRNFSDPDAPTNSEIVNEDTWIENWDNDKRTNSEINRGDINAAPLGIWITFPIRTSMNLAFRDIDQSNPGEMGLYGSARSYYPLQGISVDGHNKISESFKYNSAYTNSTGFIPHFISKPNYEEVKLQTSICFSNTHTNSISNGFRVFQHGAIKDYSIKYGGIMRILNLNENLLVIFEHGVGLISVSATQYVSGSNG